MSIRNNTVGTTEMTPVETEVTKSMKQEGAVAFKGNISIFVALCTIIQVCQYGMDFENCSYLPSNGSDFQTCDSPFDLIS